MRGRSRDLDHVFDPVVQAITGKTEVSQRNSALRRLELRFNSEPIQAVPAFASLFPIRTDFVAFNVNLNGVSVSFQYQCSEKACSLPRAAMEDR